MPSTLSISLPTTPPAPTPKPHTVYHITLRLPLRTFTLQKRYSDFTSLHPLLSSQASLPPPTALPPKNWLSSTLNNPPLIEQRRAGLEAYLAAINSAADPRWRDTPAWRRFLNLPSSFSSSASGAATNAASSLHSALTSPDSSRGAAAAVSDPVAWLDTHRELKSHLQSARTILAQRDAASSGDSSTNASDTHDASAQAKKELVRAGTLLGALDKGLRENGAEWGRQRLGEGEVRRRRDLVSAARREHESLEGVCRLVKRKGEVEGVVESLQSADGGGGQKAELLGNGGGAGVKKGRVLGKETARTRELDNRGVLQLQQQMMAEQDEDVDQLASVVRRQRELAEQINEQLEEDKKLLEMLDEDAERVGGKLAVARKRVAKIS